MHFNTKYIFQGDSESEIIEKINYNFNQILFFAVGPNGNFGPEGPTGFRGPAGKKGFSGASGDRASTWYKQPSQPVSGINQYDLWVNTSSSDGQVYAYSATGSWNFTGFTIFDSTFFSTYSWILGPAGVTDKYVIGLADTTNAATQSLVISDGQVNTSNSNPNKTKVVVSTSDQITTPVFSFAKSGAISSNVPSFYWETLGSNTGLIFKSNGDFDVTSFLDFKIETDSAPVLLQGINFNSLSTSFSLRGIGDFYFFSNTSVGGGGSFSVTTANLTLTPQYFTYANPLKISASNSGGYVLNSIPSIPQLSGGITLNITDRSTTTFALKDLTGSPIFSGKPFGTVSSGNFGQTIFGSTGGVTGATGGPFSYHVQKLKRISLPAVSNIAYLYPTTVSPITINNVVDISSLSYWDRNVLCITPTSYSSTGGIYIRVPASYLTSLSPVYEAGRSNFYRILINTTDTNPSTINILGLVFSVADFSQNPNQPTSILSYLTFGGSGCSFVDLQWLGVSNLLNSNPRLFYKTCTGVGGFANLTNYYSVGVVLPPTSLPPTGGGGGGGGGGGRGGCFVAGTLISMWDGSTKPIEEVVFGDKVKSFNLETNEIEQGDVHFTYDFQSSLLVEITISGQNVITSSPDHPYWINGKGWTSFDPSLTYMNYGMTVEEMEIGDNLMNTEGELVPITGISTRSSFGTKTYNFQVSPNMNYFANEILVHNKIIPDFE